MEGGTRSLLKERPHLPLGVLSAVRSIVGELTVDLQALSRKPQLRGVRVFDADLGSASAGHRHLGSRERGRASARDGCAATSAERQNEDPDHKRGLARPAAGVAAATCAADNA